MPNESNIDRPILIGGPGRSGTTWVLEMLWKDPDLQAVIENSAAYVTYQQMCSSWWSEIFRKVECSGDVEIQTEKAISIIRKMLCELFPSDRPHWAMKIIWGVESTWGVPLDFWRRLFPKARYIHCTRDPRTCIPSIVRYLANYPGCGTIPEAEANFLRGHRDMLGLMAAGVRYLRMPLEDVSRDPQASIRRLAAFCGLERLDVGGEFAAAPIAASEQRAESPVDAETVKLQWTDLTGDTAEISRELGYEAPLHADFRPIKQEAQWSASQELLLLSRIEALATENNELKITLKDARNSQS